jgi:3-hydroxybutyryl-CoA dehydratase
MSKIRDKAVEGIRIGDTFRVTRTFTDDDTFRFADMTRDYNPVHFDDHFAKAKKLHERICHGFMVAGLITEIGGQIGWLATDVRIRFKKAVYFGDTVTCILTIVNMDECGYADAVIQMNNQKGEEVIEAELEGFLPVQEEERRMLAKTASPQTKRQK